MDFPFEDMRIPLGEEFLNIARNEPERFPGEVVSILDFSEQIRNEVFRVISNDPKSQNAFEKEVSDNFKDVVCNKDPFEPGSRLSSEKLEDLKTRLINDDLLRRIFSREAVDTMTDGDIVILIVNMLTQNSLMQVDIDRSRFQPVDEKIIRDHGEDVATTTSLHLPFVRGKYIRPELKKIFEEMGEVFVNLSPEEAIIHGCLYFYLLSVLHPQHDFNGRMARHYMSHKIHKAVSGKIRDDKRLTLGKGPFGDQDIRFIEGFIKPIDKQMRLLLFQEFFPELAENGYGGFFAECTHPLVMLHSFQYTDPVLEQIAVSANIPPPDPKWIIGDPIGFTDEGIRWLYDEDKNDVTDVAGLFGVDPKDDRYPLFNDELHSPFYKLRFYMCRHGIKNLIPPERLKEQLGKMYKFDETPEYFSVIRKIVNDALQYLLKKSLPVFQKLSLTENGTSDKTFSRYHYVQAYREIYGDEFDFTYLPFVDMILYGLEKYRVPVTFSPFITEIIEKVANKKGYNPLSPKKTH